MDSDECTVAWMAACATQRRLVCDLGRQRRGERGFSCWSGVRVYPGERSMRQILVKPSSSSPVSSLVTLASGYLLQAGAVMCWALHGD